ncbi:hypothetical protein [Gaiella occulta]|nr:hypothetical protein [Gaiella occulta]
MRFRVSFERNLGLGLRARCPRRGGMALAWGEILSAERRVGRSGFFFHLMTGERVKVCVPRAQLRPFERQLRDAGVRIVDEYGAVIDESQYAKEADGDFVRRSVAEYRMGVRQWSDDG